jgi:hypothetical protein
MLRSLSGSKARYHYLSLVVVSEFDEWRVVVHAPEVIVQGQRQYKEAKAKEHALALAKQFIHEVRQENLPELAEVEWAPTGPQDWLVAKM